MTKEKSTDDQKSQDQPAENGVEIDSLQSNDQGAFDQAMPDDGSEPLAQNGANEPERFRKIERFQSLGKLSGFEKRDAWKGRVTVIAQQNA